MIISIITIIVSILFSLLSTVVIGYIALATPIGPWMEMTLVLLGTLFFNLIFSKVSQAHKVQALAFSTAAGGIAGAVAMACAFSFPTLYFLDPNLFNTWMSNPFTFIALLAALVIAAGSFGIAIGMWCQPSLMQNPDMVFPIGQMVYNMIAIQNQTKKALQLAFGAASALFYCLVQTFTALLPARLTLLPAYHLAAFDIPLVTTRTDMIPMFWAIGFTTGHVIAIPLLVAVITRIFLVDPIHHFWFANLSSTDYILAFGAGMAIQGALLGLIDIPKILKKSFKNLFASTQSNQTASKKTKGYLLLILLSLVFLTYFSFSIPAQVYLLLCTALCTYQLLVIAGRLGIAPLGRFATFVMVPGLILFGFNAMQVTIVATFVEIAGVVAVDMMFGQKVAQLADISKKKMLVYQWLGLLISAFAIGVIFLLLINHFGLGSPELIASRAQSRAVLVHAFNFNYWVMILGFIFSYSLKFIGVNPTLVFGGLLMGLDTSLMLIAGGLSTYLVKDKEEHYPFWSGVYATNSLWIFIKMLF
jgi:hypothetical protein